MKTETSEEKYEKKKYKSKKYDYCCKELIAIYRD